MVTILQKLGYWLLVAAAGMLAGETTARLHDYLGDGVSLLHTPNLDQDLMITGPHGVRRGRPGGVYLRWRLNKFGFRGPEIEENPGSQTRILVLGSSEAFGLYEQAGNEFPARLQRDLERRGAYEVVNASLPGMTVGSMTAQYKHWSSRFGAQIVVVYPNSLFYLNAPDAPATPETKPEGPVAAAPTKQPAQPRPESRLLLRIKEFVATPQWIVDRRDGQRVAEVRSRHEPNWVFQDIPQPQMEAFEREMGALLDAIESQGATAVIVTHARKIVKIQNDSQRAEVTRGIVHTPRATPDILLGFAAQANERLRQMAASRKLHLVDAEAALSDQPANFADLVHFNDHGAGKIAALIAEAITTIRPPASDHPSSVGAANAVQ